MPDLSNIQIKAPTTAASITDVGTLQMVKVEPFNSHVLAINQQSVSISIPGQAALVLEITDPKLLAQLQLGQKLRVTIESVSDNNIKISLEKVPAKPQPIEQVPLSRDLAAKLVAISKLPADQVTQQTYLINNSPINIGQARRLPGEMLKVITLDQKNIRSIL